MHRILINIHYMELGGAERALLGLLDALDTSRVQVDLLVNQHTGEFMPLIPGKVRLLPLDFQDAAIQPVVHYLIHAPEDALQRAEQCVLELVLRFPYTE